jgi:hypothetical protein
MLAPPTFSTTKCLIPLPALVILPLIGERERGSTSTEDIETGLYRSLPAYAGSQREGDRLVLMDCSHEDQEAIVRL